jgi:hypothetical protein
MAKNNIKSITGMTLEQISKEMDQIATSDLLAFYNKYSGKAPAKKFADRASAERQVNAILKVMLSKKADGEAKAKAKLEAAKAKAQPEAAQPEAAQPEAAKPEAAQPEAAQPEAAQPEAAKPEAAQPEAAQPSLSKKGAGVVAKMREMMEGYETDTITLEDIINETESSASTLRPVLETLHKADWIKFASDKDIQLTELGATGVLRADSKMTGAPGPKSKFRGKFLYKLVDKNPRREGTWGYRSWELIQDGMSYEAYKAAGGRNNDLQWDIDHRRIEVVDKKR